jgi:hypothetical protein
MSPEPVLQPLAALELRLEQLRERLGPDVEPALLDSMQRCIEETGRRLRALGDEPADAERNDVEPAA